MQKKFDYYDQHEDGDALIVLFIENGVRYAIERVNEYIKKSGLRIPDYMLVRRVYVIRGESKDIFNKMSIKKFLAQLNYPKVVDISTMEIEKRPTTTKSLVLRALLSNGGKYRTTKIQNVSGNPVYYVVSEYNSLSEKADSIIPKHRLLTDPKKRSDVIVVAKSSLSMMLNTYDKVNWVNLFEEFAKSKQLLIDKYKTFIIMNEVCSSSTINSLEAEFCRIFGLKDYNVCSELNIIQLKTILGISIEDEKAEFLKMIKEKYPMLQLVLFDRFSYSHRKSMDWKILVDIIESYVSKMNEQQQVTS